MAARLLTIGRCAQLTGLSIRALRLYDELGLLTPDTVDGRSRYRYYSSEQLPEAALIARLRRLSLPLEEIRRFLAADSSERVRILRAHQEQLQQQIAAAEESLQATEDLIDEDIAMVTPTVDVTPMERKTLPDQPVMRIHWALPDDSTEEYPLGTCYEEISQVIARQGLTAAGAPYCLGYEDAEDGMSRGEAGIPVVTAGVADGRVEPGALPGGEVASILYTGPSGASADAAAVTRSLWLQIESAGLIAHGNPRWVYVSEPDLPPEQHVSEFIWPIR